MKRPELKKKRQFAKLNEFLKHYDKMGCPPNVKCVNFGKCVVCRRSARRKLIKKMKSV